MSSSTQKNKSVRMVSVSIRDLRLLMVVSGVALAVGIAAFFLGAFALQSLDTGVGLTFLRLFIPVVSVVDLLLVLVGALILVVFGVLGYRTARTPSRIVPFYWMTLVTAAFEASDLIARLSVGVSWLNILGLILGICGLLLALRLRKQLIA